MRPLFHSVIRGHQSSRLASDERRRLRDSDSVLPRRNPSAPGPVQVGRLTGRGRRRPVNEKCSLPPGPPPTWTRGGSTSGDKTETLHYRHSPPTSDFPPQGPSPPTSTTPAPHPPRNGRVYNKNTVGSGSGDLSSGTLLT